MSTGRVLIIAVVVIALFSLAVLSLFVIGVMIAANDDATRMIPGLDRVALVRVNGIIDDSTELVEELDDYRESGAVRAVVIRVDSPGGGVGASRDLYEAVLRVRDEGKPVVVSMGALAASGGYYLACGADSIFAGPSTVTGSIGVIATFGSFQRAAEKLGVDFNIITTGRLKASGSEFKEMTEEERAYLQALLDDLHEQFVEAIAEGRGLETEQVRALADGRAFTGREALRLGLIDRLGTLDEALDAAARLAGLSTPPHVIERREPLLHPLRDLLRESRLLLRTAPRAPMRLEYRMH
jgi:protease-4